MNRDNGLCCYYVHNPASRALPNLDPVDAYRISLGKSADRFHRLEEGFKQSLHASADELPSMSGFPTRNYPYRSRVRACVLSKMTPMRNDEAPLRSRILTVARRGMVCAARTAIICML